MPDSRVMSTDVTVVSRPWGWLLKRAARRTLIVETAFSLHVNAAPYATFCCLNEYLEELVLGFLYTEGLIDSPAAVTKVTRRPRSWELTLDRGFSTPAAPETRKFETQATGFRISMKRIWGQMRVFSRRSALFASSGGVHSALLLHDEFELFNEDIGRHNCIDKIAGRLLESGRLEKAAEAVMLSSGRVSTEIMAKLLRLGVPVFASRTTPTAQAVRMARSHNMTLLGYVRGSRAVIYSGRERVMA
jgi:FdhD protein